MSYARLWPFLLVAAPVVAAEIRGTVTEGGKSVGASVSIDVRCGEKTYSATIDKYVCYRLFVPEKGTCGLQVHYQNQTLSREIVSFEDSTRYDLVLKKQEGQYVLLRQ